jgi:HEAT repeat protein
MVTASESYLARLQAVDQLPRDLDRAERQALYEYLLAPCAEDAQPHGLVLKNNLMLALCHQEPPPPELSEVLVQLFRDHQQNGVIRDYAVQHFTVFYERLAALPQTDQNRDDLTRLQAALWEASAETDNTIGGTALLGLSYLATQTHSLDPKAISNAALRTAQMTSASEWARSAALQACARLEVQEVVPVLRALAEQGQTTTLRLSAVGALGQVGSAADVGLLERILASTQERLKPAARLALRRIQKRAGQTPLASQ